MASTAEHRKLIRDSSAHLGPSERAEVVHQLPAGAVVAVVPEDLWSDATFFKARLDDRYVYFRSDDAMKVDEDVTPMHLLPLLDTTIDSDELVPGTRENFDMSEADGGRRPQGSLNPRGAVARRRSPSQGRQSTRRLRKKKPQFALKERNRSVSRNIPSDLDRPPRDDLAKPAGTALMGLLIIALSAGVLALTTAYPIGGYSIIAVGGFVFGPIMVLTGLLGLTTSLIRRKLRGRRVKFTWW